MLKMAAGSACTATVCGCMTAPNLDQISSDKRKNNGQVSASLTANGTEVARPIKPGSCFGTRG